METKKISELEQLEALNDATNIVVEDGGKTKRFPANQVGKVKTVNGAEPDAEGNIEVEIPEAPEVLDTNGKLRNSVLPEGYPYCTGGVMLSDETAISVTDTEASTKSPFDISLGVGALVVGNAYRVIWDGVAYDCVAYLTYYDSVVGIGNASFFTSHLTEGDDEPFMIYEYNGECKVCTNVAGEHTVSVLSGIVITPMSEEFLPTEAAHVSTAEVGQVIAVKAVDDNGKPTEWEAVDMASGGVMLYGSGSHLYHDADCTEKVTNEELMSIWQNVTHIVYDGAYYSVVSAAINITFNDTIYFSVMDILWNPGDGLVIQSFYTKEYEV